MKRQRRRAVAVLMAWICVCAGAKALTCSEMEKTALKDGKITAVTDEPAGSFTPKGGAAIEGLPAFCRVEATLTPSADSEIRIEVWLPEQGWNGRYEGIGNGGYAGSFWYPFLAGAVKQGYAVANTDMGMATGGKTADIFMGRPERWADWGWRSTHAMTVAAKEIVREFYSKPAEHAYFWGCSTGGEMALMEAQRFPDDYDGIVSGAPAHNRTHVNTEVVWAYAALESKPEDKIPAAKLKLMNDAVLAACPKAKAAAGDGFLSYPDKCKWDPKALECKEGDGGDCLSAAQVEAARKLYAGPHNPVTHAAIYPGVPRGSETGWTGLEPEANRPPYDPLFTWVFGSGWNWRNFDYNRDMAKVDAQLSGPLNATNPDLSTFKAHGHKLLLYHGWADWLVPPGESVNYYQSVEEAQGGAAQTEDFFRLFMVPGMSHCWGGPGLTAVDPLPAMVKWVEDGKAPEEMTAERMEGGKAVLTRPICPYPEAAHYKGSGDTKDAGSFACRR